MTKHGRDVRSNQHAEAAIDPGFASVEYAGADLEALQVLRQYRDWILNEFKPHLSGAAVEIGAGIGSYSELLLKFVSSLDLVEPSALQFRHLEQRFLGDPRIRVLQAGAEAWAQAAPSESRDTIIMINVLEHISDDVQTLRDLHRVLRPGGHLLLFVPALMLLYSRLDSLLGHHRRYDRSGLTQKVEGAGFDVLWCHYFDFLGILPWLVVNRLGGATTFSPKAASLYDAVGVPMTRTLERYHRPPIGKNLILAATRA